MGTKPDDEPTDATTPTPTPTTRDAVRRTATRRRPPPRPTTPAMMRPAHDATTELAPPGRPTADVRRAAERSEIDDHTQRQRPHSPRSQPRHDLPTRHAHFTTLPTPPPSRTFSCLAEPPRAQAHSAHGGQ